MDYKNLPKYRWPDLSSVIRQYLVQDDYGRFGIATYDPIHHDDTLWARPIATPRTISGSLISDQLPNNAIVITSTSWHIDANGLITGWWYDDDVPTFPLTVPPEMIRKLTIIDDLGWIMPDKWANQALAGSEDPGYWDYGAKLGKVGGLPPIKGQAVNEMTIEDAVEYARDIGINIQARSIRAAAAHDYIPGARKIGRDWLIPYDGLNHYLDNRPKPGRK